MKTLTTMTMKSSMVLKRGMTNTLLKYVPCDPMNHTKLVKRLSMKDPLLHVEPCLGLKGLSLCLCLCP